MNPAGYQNDSTAGSFRRIDPINAVLIQISMSYEPI
jgi:hypothetical protein